MKIKIEYYSGAGNIFCIIDKDYLEIPTGKIDELARLICGKFEDFTMETEGMILVGKSTSDDFAFDVEFYNPDGSTGMMCGNGARCAVSFASSNNKISHDLKPQNLVFRLAGKEYSANFENEKVEVVFPPPSKVIRNFSYDFNGKIIDCSFVDVGTLHLLFDYDKIPMNENFNFDFYPLQDFAVPVRWDIKTFPNGVNVSICKNESNSIKIRTFERGVEKETGACGTAAVSLGILEYLRDDSPEVNIIPTSQIPLLVRIHGNETQSVQLVSLIGSAEKIGERFIEGINL